MTGVIPAGDLVFDDGVLRIARMAPPPVGLILTGEADEMGYQPLVEALAGLPSHNGTGPPEVHLDLSGLQFCDAAALHAMIAPAADGTRRMVLHDPPAGLRAMICIAGWCRGRELPGLRVVTS